MDGRGGKKMGNPLGVALMLHAEDLPLIADIGGVETEHCDGDWHIATSESEGVFDGLVDDFHHAFLIEWINEDYDGRVSLEDIGDSRLRGRGGIPIDPFRDAVLSVVDSCFLADEQVIAPSEARNTFLFGDKVWVDGFASIVPNEDVAGRMDRLDALPEGERKEDLHALLR